VSKTAQPPSVLPSSTSDLMAVVRRAQKGDQTTLPAVRELLLPPDNVNTFGGDLPGRVQQALISKMSGDDLLQREALTRKLELMRADLAGPDPTPLERLLVERW
jgi:hypothetical protein